VSGLTIGEFVALSGGRLVGEALRAAAAFAPSTDSRTISSGESFVCLRGAHFDGHAFIAQALARGAAAVVVDDVSALPVPCPVPAVATADAKQAYLRGAAALRSRSQAVVVGVTGSTGKTTTKEFTRQLLERSFRVLATHDNENNELGVAKVCYQLLRGAPGSGPEIAVAEMGARHPGEIAELVEIARPDVGVLTNVGEAHLEFFENQAELARTKFALLERGARGVCSAADEWTRRLAAQAGIEKTTLWVRRCGDPTAPGLTLEAGVPQSGQVPLTLGASHAFAGWHLIGEHHLQDALLAVGAALHCGLTFEAAIAGLGELRLPPGRFELHRLPGGATVIFDAYNASPAAVAYALRALGEVPAQRRIAVLGSMAELGALAESRHEQTGAAAATAALFKLYCGGEHAAALANGALRAGMPRDAVATFHSNEEIAATLRAELQAGDAVLLKGSRVQRMEQILDALASGGAPTRVIAS